MTIVHLSAIAFRDIPNGNRPLGGGLFKREGNRLVSYLDLQGTNARFPMEIHPRGILLEATYPDGTKGFVDHKVLFEFDFDEDSSTW